MKIFDENSIEKLNFELFLENLLLKIELSEITSFFLQEFFPFRGGGDFPPVPPGYATVSEYIKYADKRGNLIKIRRMYCILPALLKEME